MLTETDRQFLKGKKEYTGENAKQMRYERRTAIRERVRQSLKDFSTLFDNLDAEEAGKILKAESVTRDPHTRFDDEEIEEGLRDALAFILREAGITSLMGETARPYKPTVEQLLLEALRRIGRAEGYGVSSVELEIDSVRIPRTQVIRSLKEGRDIPPETLAYLLEDESVDKMQIQEALRDMLDDAEDDE